MKKLSPMVVTLPIRLVSESNARDNWRKKYKRSADQRGTVKISLHALLGRPPAPPLVVTITRIGKKSLDGDNLQGSAKASRDGVADYLGIDDGSDAVTWLYAQEPGPYAVRIAIERRT